MPELITAQISSGNMADGGQRVWRHAFHVLGLLMSGEGHCTNGPVRSPAAPPWLGFVPEGQKDGNMLQGPFESRYVCFRWEALRVTPGRNRFTLSLNGSRLRVNRFAALDTESASLCARLIADIRRDLQTQDLAARLRAEECFLRLFRTYTRIAGHVPMDEEHRELVHYRELIDQHACDPVSLEALAERCRMSPDYLCRLFKRCFGTTPKAHRTALRMTRARELLSSTTMNVTETAWAVGYDDPLYFSRMFKQYFGQPPSRMIRTPIWPSAG